MTPAGIGKEPGLLFLFATLSCKKNQIEAYTAAGAEWKTMGFCTSQSMQQVEREPVPDVPEFLNQWAQPGVHE